MTARRKRTAAEVPEQGTRERLMRSALKLFASDGLKGVSMRRIVKEAGAANSSALLYHFGTREALIEEIGGFLQYRLEPLCLARLQVVSEKASYSARDVVEAVFLPVVDLLYEPDFGKDAIRFLARLAWEFGPEGQELSARIHRKALNRALELVERLFPQTPRDAIQVHLILNMATAYHSLAELNYMWRSPFGAVGLLQKKRNPELQKIFFDHLAAGLSASQ